MVNNNNNNNDKIPERKKVGEILSSTREEAGISIDKVVDSIRIKKQYLVAIESCQYEKLPGIPYAIGFIRSYANYLGFNGEEAVLLFKAEINDIDSSDAKYIAQEPLSENSLPKKHIVLLGIAIIVACVVLWQRALKLDREAAIFVPSIDDEYVNRAPVEEVVDNVENKKIGVSDVKQVKNDNVQVAKNSYRPTESLENVKTITINDKDKKKVITVVEIKNSSNVLANNTDNVRAQTAQAEAINEAVNEAVNVDQIETGNERDGNSIKSEEVVVEPHVLAGMSKKAFDEAIKDFMLPRTKPAMDLLLKSLPKIKKIKPKLLAENNESLLAEITLMSNNQGKVDSGNDINNERIKIYGMDNIGTRVVIVAKKDSFIKITRGSQAVLSKNLQKGDKVFSPLPKGKKVSLMTNNAGALDIIVDESMHVTPGEIGEVKANFSLMVSDLKSFLNDKNNINNKKEDAASSSSKSVTYKRKKVDRR
ncbi:MAG: hypothetical protein GY804_10665 [Alphaproteobacteria bacterium]|nr:hypothetical protein [Alphaproteobacteria bacterium]